jgi:ubiquinone/menaquinone biosynthesis C-methylase UbiE
VKHDSAGKTRKWDHSTREEFYDKYAHQSLGAETRERFLMIRDKILRVVHDGKPGQTWSVLDVGCNTGAQCLLWSELGHRVYGLDVNEKLLELARVRAAEAGRNVEFVLGTAASLPWPENHMDVCLAVELLEHVPDWEDCLKEFARVVRPGGVLFLATSNKLCPVQNEFNLPLYSWYPAPIKRWCERLSVTTRPWLANYATYPAMNWFTVRQLARELDTLGFDSMDKFDVADVSTKGRLARAILALIRRVPPIRWLAHCTTPTSVVFAMKRQPSQGNDHRQMRR